MIRLISILFVLFSLNAFGQKNPTEQAQPIVVEGKRLYRSEMASWYGTDLFLENYKNRENIGGYFSYIDSSLAKCVFFSKADKPKIIGTISFDSSYNIKTATSDLNERDLTVIESELYEIRKIALTIIKSDTLFSIHK